MVKLKKKYALWTFNNFCVVKIMSNLLSNKLNTPIKTCKCNNFQALIICVDYY